MSPLITARSPHRQSDARLVERAREGDKDAFGELFRRHAAAGVTVARSFSSLDPEDLVAEAFARIYDAVVAGGGPRGAFRPYLFTTIRNTAASWGRRASELPVDDLDLQPDPATDEHAALEALDRGLTARAFRSLPTRWQEVLWYSEVEQMAPREVAPLLGMSANATAALAYRAREGLRQAWIRVHLQDSDPETECGWTIERLGTYARGRLGARDATRVDAHLDECARCTIVAVEAHEVGSRLAMVLLPLSAGATGATAYAGWLQAGAPATVVAMGAAGAGGAANGGSSGSGMSGGAITGAAVGTAAVAATVVAAVALGPTLVGETDATSAAPAAAVAASGLDSGDDGTAGDSAPGPGPIEELISQTPDATDPRATDEPGAADDPADDQAADQAADEAPDDESASDAPADDEAVPGEAAPEPIAPAPPPTGGDGGDDPTASDAPFVSVQVSGGVIHDLVLTGTPGATVAVSVDGQVERLLVLAADGTSELIPHWIVGPHTEVTVAYLVDGLLGTPVAVG
ncbi:sigma-70 family RNA polymerase sigma factor [Agromyces rhizosphaerae]|uniref:sigma-70 family RNA polymerase sigma factor n=1 Tax=Agromyces rhizosphaerae TaxID=88374 RepID=UPI0024936573|nr:sigma-70 family RNA polymerase sigma factor [Agromyces rhizosphaerae]